MHGWIFCALIFVPVLAPAAEAEQALFAAVVDKARTLAGKPYRDAGAAELPKALEGLDYQAYRDIRFRKEHALWAGAANFNVEFFHPGFLYRHTVTIHEVVDGKVRTIPFEAAMFDYGEHGVVAEKAPADLGFAGFRLHYPLHDPGYKDELIAFLGASYFRMVGRGQRYGLSARGLAIDTALPSGEEFPRFTEFWLVRPPPRANRMRMYALLDSESLTGAYAFEIESRVATVLDVRMRLFAREDVAKLGVAPLTSMFAWGENRVRPVDDYRPEVHDSDGLLQHTGAGEWIWRPLVNPPALQVSSLLDRDPNGFGLAQRDRSFSSYEDPEARYDRRPGLWVTPAGDWGRGAVQLVEIPSPDETHDNIVAYWVGDRPFKAGETRSFSYELRTFEETENPAGLAIVTGTRIGWGAIPGAEQKPPHSVRQFVVDFTGGQLEGLTGAQPVAADLTVERGKAETVTVAKLPVDEGWRVAFKLHPAQADQLVNMRLFLTLRGHRVSETWNYIWDPATVPSP